MNDQDKILKILQESSTSLNNEELSLLSKRICSVFEVSPLTSLLAFNDDSQIGDITIDDVAGRDIFKLFQIQIQNIKYRQVEIEEILKNLIVYKPGAIAYQLLVDIEQRNDVMYNDEDEIRKRCLNHLLDDGYLMPASDDIGFIYFSSRYNGKRLCEIASLAPIGKQLVEYRRKILNKI
jgi:hypothetical protein